MPIVSIEVFEGRLNDETERRLIEGVTDVFVDVFGLNVKDATWVVLKEIAPTRWGIGGKASQPLK